VNRHHIWLGSTHEEVYGNALQAASVGGHNWIVELLLGKGADINAQAEKYGSALQAASAEGNDRIVELLLGKGADVNAQGGYYGSALQAALVRGYDQIVELLLGSDRRPSDDHCRLNGREADGLPSCAVQLKYNIAVSAHSAALARARKESGEGDSIDQADESA
jgi:ankyrin repeat protein